MPQNQTLTLLTERGGRTHGNQSAAAKLIKAIQKARPELTIHWIIYDPLGNPLLKDAELKNITISIVTKSEEINTDWFAKENNMVFIFPELIDFPKDKLPSPDDSDAPLVVQCNQYDYQAENLGDIQYVSGLGKESIGIFLAPKESKEAAEHYFPQFGKPYFDFNQLFFCYYSGSGRCNKYNSQWGLYKKADGKFDMGALRAKYIHHGFANWYRLSANGLFFNRQVSIPNEPCNIQLTESILTELNQYFETKDEFSQLTKTEIAHLASLTKHDPDAQRNLLIVDQYFSFLLTVIFYSVSQSPKKNIDLMLNVGKSEAIFLSLLLDKFIKVYPEHPLIQGIIGFSVSYDGKLVYEGNEETGIQIRIVNPFPLSPKAFKALVTLSHDLIGLTGDQSFCEGIEQEKTILYPNDMPWKKDLTEAYLDIVEKENPVMKELFETYQDYKFDEIPLQGEGDAKLTNLLEQIQKMVALLTKENGAVFLKNKSVSKKLYEEKNLYNTLPTLILQWMDNPLQIIEDNDELYEKLSLKLSHSSLNRLN